MFRFRLSLVCVAAVALMVVCVTTTAVAGAANLDTTGLQKLLQSDPNSVFLLDVRTPREFASGRIPGSVLIPMNQVPNRLAEIPRDRKVVVICATGGRSSVVSEYLSDSGFPDVVNYTGGVSAWAGRGLQLER